MFSLKVIDGNGRTIAVGRDEEEVNLMVAREYQEGDRILLETSEKNIHVWFQVDDAMGKSLVYLTGDAHYQIPFGEKRINLSPKTFSGSKHLITVRKAKEFEPKTYRNLALNVNDLHENETCFPHAFANVETRGESVFAARNAIDGVTATLSHGKWPYESWGINRRDDAELLLEFGRPVDIDQVRLWTRADFPHDNWWVSAVLTFSDGTREVVNMEKSEKAHTFAITKKGITWVRLSDLIKADDPSPFPALTQIEVYGKEA